MDANNHIDTALRNGVDRIVIKHEARDELNGEIREIYAELKDAGFNVTVVRGMVKEQRMEPEARNAMYQQQEEYRIKLGLLAAIGPLGEAAIARETAERAYQDDRERTANPLDMPRPFAEQPVHDPKRKRG